MNPSIQPATATPRNAAPRVGNEASGPSGAAAGDFGAALRAALPAPTPDKAQPRQAQPPRHEATEDREHRVPEAPPSNQASRPRRAPGSTTTPPGGPQAQAPAPDATAPQPMPEALPPPDAGAPLPEAPIAVAPELPAWNPVAESPIAPNLPKELPTEPGGKDLEASPPADPRQPPVAWLPAEAPPPQRSPLPQQNAPDAQGLPPTAVLADARAAAARVAKPAAEPGLRSPGTPPAQTAAGDAAQAADAASTVATLFQAASLGSGAQSPSTVAPALREAAPPRGPRPEGPNPEAPRTELPLPEAGARADWMQAAMPALHSLPPSLALPASPPLALNQPAFADELGAQVAMWTRQGVQQAELRLNPAEMGPVQVRIQLSGEQAQVQFVAEAAATRDALQAALPELSQALAAEGLQLAGADVQAGRQDAREPRQDGAPQRPAASGRATTSGGAEATEGGERLGAASPAPRAARGLLDLYA